jgi:LysM repeat protein
MIIKNMNMPIIIIIIIFALNICYGAFEDVVVNATALALNNTMTAYYEDIATVYTNPAAMSRFNRLSIMLGYSRLYPGLWDRSVINRGSFAYLQPLSIYGCMGVLWNELSLLNAYSEDMLGLSYGKNIYNNISIGLLIKYYRLTYIKDDYIANDPLFGFKDKTSVGTSALSLDISTLYLINYNFSIGAKIENIAKTKLGIKDYDLPTTMLKFGTMHTFENIILLIDLLGTQNNKYKLSTGVEISLSRTVALRAAIGLGNNNIRDASIGISYTHKLFSINYGLKLPLVGIENTWGTHSIDLNFYFTGKSRTDRLVEYYSSRGDQYYNDNNFSQAIVEYSRALKLDPFNKKIEDKLRLAGEKIQNTIKNMEEIIKKATEMEEKARSASEEAENIIKKAQEKIELIEKMKLEQIKTEKKEERPKTYVINEGDTLESIAEKFYGDKDYWIKIYNLNKDKVKKGTLIPGDVIILP